MIEDRAIRDAPYSICKTGLRAMAGTLYIVATPIGNLEDITFRAVRVLGEVDLIAAEDTRHTQILLARHGIHTPLTSYHDHNERAKARELAARLETGTNIALVSDAGTPAISDPGFRLVVEAIRVGARIVPVPGASALTAILSSSGLPTDRFVFEGFLPAKKKQRRERLRAMRDETRTLIFYETPHRLKDSLDDILEILDDREIAVAREVTKMHEEFLRGRVSEIFHQVAEREIKGELTLVIAGLKEEPRVPRDRLREEIHALAAEGMRIKEIAEVLATKYAQPKKMIYRMALEQKKSATH
jgi:16S rRNA (cytidine1402-2'-O)-methyltransferase